MYDRILVPVDGGPGTERVVEEALELATLTDADLHALSVIDTRDYGTLPEAKWLTIREEFEREAEQALTGVRTAVGDAVSLTTATERGVPHEAILAYATEKGCDCIVMGTHGRSGLDRVLLGSVTERVTRHASVPVLVVHIDEEHAD
jgi:nucleotide-binding universal stress UspA family protein